MTINAINKNAGGQPIILSGQNANAGTNGLVFAALAAGSQAIGLSIVGFKIDMNTLTGGDGIDINGANNVTVEGCNIGTDSAGTQNIGNQRDGIQIVGASNCVIGSVNGTNAGRNVIGSTATMV